jgi:hypothetical protein
MKAWIISGTYRFLSIIGGGFMGLTTFYTSGKVTVKNHPLASKEGDKR